MSKTLFDDIDKMELRFAGRDWMPIVSDVALLRKRILILVVICAGFWVLLGFDSTWEMIFVVEKAIFDSPFSVIPDLLNPNSQLRIDMWSLYGIGDHWSMPVMYGLTAIWLSLRMEKRGIVKSLNFFTTAGIMMMVGGVFEFIWNRFYGVIHGQPFVYTFELGNKQTLNLIVFAFMILLGVFSIMVLWNNGYRFDLRRYKKRLIFLTFMLWVIWIYYPFSFTRITVETQWGPWVSGSLFPQTFYAVKISDVVAKGFFVENNWLHLLNVACKWVFTFTSASICLMVKKK